MNPVRPYRHLSMRLDRLWVLVKRVTILFPIIAFTFLLTVSAFALIRPLTKEEQKELRKHYLIGKRYYNAQEDKKAIEEFKIVLALDPSHEKATIYLSESHYHLGRRYYRDKDYGRAKQEFEKALAGNPKHRKAKEYLSRCRTKVKVEVAEGVPEEIVTEGPPERIVIAEAPKEEEIEEGIGVLPSPLPPGAKVIHSTDVVSGVKAEMVRGKARVTIILSGERKYTVLERGRPPSIIIDIPHTINTVSPERIVVNQGGVRTVEVTQYRLVPMEETRVVIRLSRFKEYEIKSKDNEIYVEFEE